MTIHKVRAHLRTSRGGISHLVWEHYRQRGPGAPPLTFRVFNSRRDIKARDAILSDSPLEFDDPEAAIEEELKDTTAFMLPSDPNTIYLTRLAAKDMRALPRILGHETLHSVLNRLDLPEAPRALDARRSYYGAGMITMEPMGIYRYRTRKRP